MKIENLPNEIVEDFNYMFDTYLKEDILKIYANELKTNEVDIILQVVKKEISNDVVQLYELMEIFKKSNLPIKAKDYERFYKDLSLKQKELQEYSKGKIEVDNAPLHPNILYYYFDYKMTFYKLNHREFANFIYSKIKFNLGLSEKEFEKKPILSKAGRVHLVGMFNRLKRNTEDKELIKNFYDYLKTLPFKSWSPKSGF